MSKRSVQSPRSPQSPTCVRAGWLTRGLLLLIGDGGAPSVCVCDAKGEHIIRTDSVIIDDQFVSVARVPDPSAWPARSHVRVGTTEFTARDLDSSICDATALAQRILAALHASSRKQVIDLIVRASAHASSRTLSRTLLRIRESIRERQPACVETPDHPLAIGIGTIVQADHAGRAIYVRGWARDLDGEVSALVAVSPEGERIDLLGSAARFARKDVPIVDVHEQGFISLAKPIFPNRLADGWVFELHGTSESAVERIGPSAIVDPIRARDAILEDLTESRFADDHAVLKPIAAALQHWQASYGGEAQIARVDAFGCTPKSPEVSIIVPLFERIDLIEQQFAQFIHDPELQRRAEMIYVLDSPELVDSLRETASMLYRLYGLPLRTITLRRGRSFAAAVNAGAGESRGRLLLTMHSDVFADRPGWLAEMIRFHDSQPRDDIGAVGPKLLHEDDAIQHAGLQFVRSPGARFWQPAARFKGFHRDAPQAAAPSTVPAVSGACMLVARDVFDQIGRLPNDYLGGATADLDFCLRLAESGRRNWYLPSAELYHLEGQSWIDPTRPAAARFNRWQLTQRWDARIAETMSHIDLTADRAAEVQRCR